MKFRRFLDFQKIDKNIVKILYQLLEERLFSISHKVLPSYEIHKNL